jgi:hypothetical protein
LRVFQDVQAIGVYSALAVALVATDNTLLFGAFLAVFKRRQLGGIPPIPIGSTPDLAVFGHCDGATMFWTNAEDDLTALDGASLERSGISRL